VADPEALLRLLQWRLSLAQGDGEAQDPRDIRDWLWLSLQLDGVQLPRTFAPFPPQSAEQTQADHQLDAEAQTWPEPSDDDATAKELPPPEPLTPDPFLPRPFPVDPPRPELEEEPVARLLAETTLPDDADVDDALWTRHGARSLRVSEIALLPFPLKVLRALGPLLQRRPHPRLRVLDEERSATMSAETRLAWPVFRPRRMTQVRLRVVLDAGVSMAVWEPLAQELQRVLASSQAFRRVVVQRLEPSQLTALEREGGAEEQTTVILLLSDSAGHHWWDGSILPWLQHKARSHPLVLIHTLPQRYWATTALSQAELVTFSNRVPLAPNSRYRTIRRLPNPWDAPKPSGPELEPALYLPVISLDRRELAHWAALAAGEPRARSSGRVFAKVAAPASSPAAGASAADQALTLEEAEHLWEEFESRASPDAQELLLAMAASPVLSLPILRLLQAAEAPRAFSPQPLAEVLVSGLVRRLEGQGKDVPPERLQFELVPAVRRLLEPRLSPERRRQVLASVTDLLERHWNKQGTGPSFKALLLGPKEELDPDLIHIANVTAAMLDRLPGRQFRELAAQLRGRESEALPLSPWPPSMAFEELGFESAQLVSVPELLPIPFTAAWFAQVELRKISFDIATLEGTAGNQKIERSLNALKYDVISASTFEGTSTIHYSIKLGSGGKVMRAQSSQRRLVEQLVAQASNGNSTDHTIGHTLFKLLVPLEMEAALGGTSTLVLELDQGSAPIPWEMLDTKSGALLAGDHTPWAIRTKLIRKLKLEDFRQQPRDASLSNGVLVIGEPHCGAPRLPGARREAKAVGEKLRSHLGEDQVDCLIAPEEKEATGPKAAEIINKLLERHWRIVHISGHGMPADENDPRGVVLSHDLYLGAREIKTMRVVPELVFVNCCHLAATNEERLLDKPYNRAKFAASVAEQLIHNGVRCVVAAGWAVSDAGAELFATRFYDELLRGQRFIDAIATARRAVFENAGVGDNTWAAYQCYGDPDWVLLQQQGFVPSIGKAWAFHEPLQRDHLPFGATVERPDPLALTLVEIPRGTFQMGSPPDEPERGQGEGPQHPVTLESFFMSQAPITQAQWREVAQWQPKEAEHWERELKPNPSGFQHPGVARLLNDEASKDGRPVEQVSWDDAMEFCSRLSQRTGRTYTLPSEAQWEYACRAGTTTPFAFGETITPELANYNSDYTYGVGRKGEFREQTTPVGMFPANAWGLRDMHGNVWEWCLDHWHESYEGAPQDGSAWLVEEGGNRLLRGGSWYFVPRGCRSAYRRHNPPGNANDDVGFRVVCLPQGPSLNP